MSCEFTQVQRDLIDRAAKENGLKNYELILHPASSKGGNFLGVLTAVTIKGDNGKKVDLVLKSVISDKNPEISGSGLRDAFVREIYLYGTILKEFRKFEEGNNIKDPFSSIAKMYSSSNLNDNECLLMENLRTAGYQLWDKTIPMNPDHIKKVITEYAKFHAISLAMNYIQPELFDELTKNMTSNITNKEEMLTEERLRTFAKTVTKDVYEAVAGDQMLIDYVKKMENKFVQFVGEEWKKPEYMCIVDHGDPWCNNLMFKYQDPTNSTTPIDIRIIDWQLSRLNSPLSDFCYFFLSHADKKALDDYDSYEEIYYNSLYRRLLDFNCDPEELFPYERFIKHRNLFMPIHLFTCYVLLKIMLSEPEEAPNFSNVIDDLGAIAKQLDYEIKHLDIYKRRVKDVTEFMVKNKFGGPK